MSPGYPGSQTGRPSGTWSWGRVTLHFFREEWEELQRLVQLARRSDAG